MVDPIGGLSIVLFPTSGGKAIFKNKIHVILSFQLKFSSQDDKLEGIGEVNIFGPIQSI